MNDRNIKFAEFMGIINTDKDLGKWFLENPKDEEINFSFDWNKVHELKEFIESQYEVFVHILGKGCLVTTTNSKLLEANDWNDCLAMLEISPEEVQSITGIEWANRVLEIFIDKIKRL